MNTLIKISTSIIIISCLSTVLHSQVDCSEWLPSECEDAFLAFAEYTLDNGECKQWKDDCDIDRPIYRTGSVSIGTSSQSEATLTVTEGVVSPNMKICENAESWCDYVFENDYELLSLECVENHINNFGHLHKTLSAEEVESAGNFDVGDVAFDHQEKIEELFLHMIAMKKKADVLQEKLAFLQAENKTIKKALAKD